MFSESKKVAANQNQQHNTALMTSIALPKKEVRPISSSCTGKNM